jgi:hypothetical protein
MKRTRNVYEKNLGFDPENIKNIVDLETLYLSRFQNLNAMFYNIKLSKQDKINLLEIMQEYIIEHMDVFQKHQSVLNNLNHLVYQFKYK